MATNLDKHVHYMVYTSKGHYEAMGLLPGKYEVTVQKDGFLADTRIIQVKSGDSAKVDFKLMGGGPARFSTYPGYPFFAGQPLVDWKKVTEFLPYDTLYPPGPGRDLIDNTCVVCHDDRTYLPGHPRSAADWRAIIDSHMEPNSGRKVIGVPPGALVPPTLTESNKDTLVAYLGANFGPGPKRGIRIDENELPLDETVLAKAMFVEYYLPLDPKLDAANTRRAGQDPQLDQNGNVWYTDNSVPSRVGMLNPRTAEFKDYLLPDPHAYPHGITVDAANDIWWAERDAALLGRLDQKTGKMTHYLSDPEGSLKGPWWAHTPVVDSKQNIWFSSIGNNVIGKWDRQAGRVTKLYRYPTPWALSYGMAVDKQDNIWVAEYTGCKIAKFDQATEQFTEYASLRKRCAIFRLGVDPEGKVWYATRDGYLGRIDPGTGEITERRIPFKHSVPYDVQADSQGMIWFSDTALGGALVRFDPHSEKFSYFPAPQMTDIPRINISPEGAVWYCPRSAVHGAVGVFYPDITKFKELRSQ